MEWKKRKLVATTRRRTQARGEREGGIRRQRHLSGQRRKQVVMMVERGAKGERMMTVTTRMMRGRGSAAREGGIAVGAEAGAHPLVLLIEVVLMIVTEN